jgi:hypothetical protein
MVLAQTLQSRHQEFCWVVAARDATVPRLALHYQA